MRRLPAPTTSGAVASLLLTELCGFKGCQGGLARDPAKEARRRAPKKTRRKRLRGGALVPSTLRVEFASVTLGGVPTDESRAGRESRCELRCAVRSIQSCLLGRGVVGSLGGLLLLETQETDFGVL